MEVDPFPQPFEPRQVDGLRGDLQRITSALRDKRTPRAMLSGAERRHVHRLARGIGRGVTPELVDEPLL